MNNQTLYIILNRINKIVFSIILFELFLGGGGRLTEFGFLTLRMILFFVFLAVNIPIFIISRKVKKYLIELLILFTFPLLFSFAVGFINHTELSKIFEDIKPLAYFYSFIFFYLNIKELSDVKWVCNILKISSIIMALVYILVYFLMNYGFINYPEFYKTLSSYSEFAFRGSQAIFYKGFLFMCIGFFFFFNENRIQSKLFAFVIFIAIFLTFTRGFILSIILAYFIYMLFFKKINVNTILILVFSITFLVAVFGYFQTQNIGDKSESNRIRITTFNQVFERTDLVDVFIGHGFGNGVPIRNVHMEISYLEIFYKQGLIGLAFWAYLLAIVIRFYRKAILNNNEKYAKPLLLAVLFVYVQSFTNPFINNPIGMSMIITAIVALQVLGNKEKNKYDISLHTNL